MIRTSLGLIIVAGLFVFGPKYWALSGEINIWQEILTTIGLLFGIGAAMLAIIGGGKNANIQIDNPGAGIAALLLFAIVVTIIAIAALALLKSMQKVWAFLTGGEDTAMIEEITTRSISAVKLALDNPELGAMVFLCSAVAVLFAWRYGRSRRNS